MGIRGTATMLVGAALLACPARVVAQPVQPTAPAMTTADVEAFLDGMIPYQLEREDIAGLSIAIVKDGAVLLAKGYGYADIAKRRKVTVDTLFRPGSISKLFTWTAVMQQVEQGKLSLDRDVNSYLDFRIPEAFGTPLTLRHIMTHTSGFEEANKDLFVPSAAALVPLRQYLVMHLPKRIFRSGTMPAYSNYATALAAHMVARISGMRFEDYVDRFILQPLRMSHSTLRQPLPAALQPHMSQGYLRASQDPKSFEVIPAFPAGSLSASANDMARFMLAHLQDGELDGTRILKADTARVMHARHFGLHPKMNGMALGFYEESRNGHRVIGHGGDTLLFHSDLHLMHDARFGFYMSLNSAGKGEASVRTQIWRKLLDRYFPYVPPSATLSVERAKRDVEAVLGSYMSSRRSETTVVAMANAIAQLRVTANPDGTISTSSSRDLNGEPTKAEWIAPMEFRDVKGETRLLFQKDRTGRMTMLIPYPFMVFQRTSGIESYTFIVTLLLTSLSVILLTLLLWPIASLVRWHYGFALRLTPEERRRRLLVKLACGMHLGGLIVIGVLGSKITTPGAFNASLDPMLRLMQGFFLLGALGSSVVVLDAIKTVRSNTWWWAKLHASALALSFLGLAWLHTYWHVFTPSLSY